MIKSSELIINADGSIYHLKAKPGQLSDIVITVGDPERVKMFEQHFSKIESRIENREFQILTGIYNGKLISVLSTGIGTDNIDIAINELDALFNIDFSTRKLKDQLTQLKLIRIGTSGAIREEIPLDSFIVSNYAIGFDGLLHFYDSRKAREENLENLMKERLDFYNVYAVGSSDDLVQKFSSIGARGITLTAPGFYGPQSRSLRLPYTKDLIKEVNEISYKKLHCTNLEMETAGIYGLSKMMGHEAISLNAILANRVTGDFSSQPIKTVHRLIDEALFIIQKM